MGFHFSTVFVRDASLAQVREALTEGGRAGLFSTGGS